MRLKVCKEHGYSLKEFCIGCGKKTSEAHYKFVKIKSVKDDEKTQKSVF